MRQRVTKAFLWMAVLAAGPLVGAKLFDLIVLAGSWSADPPRSLALCPTEQRGPSIRASSSSRHRRFCSSRRSERSSVDSGALSDTQAVGVARRWVQLDWIRVAGGAAAFVAALCALTSPWPAQEAPRDPPLVRILLVTLILGVVAFVVWFVSNI
jgi:hypothetical protein